VRFLLVIGGMLVLALSASLTPANAAFMCNGADIWHRGPFIAWGSANASCGAPPTCGTAPGTNRGVVLLCYRLA
jgi:hypothetical protein